MEDESCKRVLEIGCGAGSALKELAKRYEHIEFYGIDVNTSYFEPRLMPSNVRLLEGDAHNLQFEDGFFDVVFSRWVLGYIIDKLKVISESFRVLKDGGKGMHNIDLGTFKVELDLPLSGYDLFPRSNGTDSPICFFPSEPEDVLKLHKNGKPHNLNQYAYDRMIHSTHGLDPVLTIYKKV